MQGEGVPSVCIRCDHKVAVTAEGLFEYEGNTFKDLTSGAMSEIATQARGLYTVDSGADFTTVARKYSGARMTREGSARKGPHDG